jgi:DNA-binding HxlR family transcriptional regulator
MNKTRRSPCPVACTLDLIGDKWTLLIVRDLVLGRQYFKDFLASPERIATNVLTDRLTRLIEAGLVQTCPSEERVGRSAYKLTPKGESLKPVLKAVTDWGLQHIEGTEIRIRRKPGQESAEQ